MYIDNNVLFLITDRKESDVTRAKRIFTRINAGTATESEKSEFMAGMKGAYNVIDLNRVENAALYVSNRLKDLPDELKEYATEKYVAWDPFFDVGYDIDDIDINVKTDWTHGDYFDFDNQNRYLNNILQLSLAFELDATSLPSSFSKFNYYSANMIEKRLVDINNEVDSKRDMIQILIDNTAKIWYYSGEIYGGEI